MVEGEGAGEDRRREGGGVRLTAREIEAIKTTAREVFGADVIVRVFGSRLDDARRGGDIDLHVQLAQTSAPIDASARFRRLLEQRVGEREYDIIVAAHGQRPSPVDSRAMVEGYML